MRGLQVHKSMSLDATKIERSSADLMCRFAPFLGVQPVQGGFSVRLMPFRAVQQLSRPEVPLPICSIDGYDAALYSD